MVLSILQWNARSLIANGQEFKKFIANQEKGPDIICIQETWLKSQYNFLIQGYITIRRDRHQGNGGGVATFIKQGIGYKTVEVDREIEVVVVEIWEGSRCIRIINFYNPCDRLSKDILESIGGNGSQKTVWCGDFNAHSSIWGSAKTDYNGEIIEDMLDWGRLVCINDGSHTRIDLYKGRHSALDLTIVSESLASKCEWKVLIQSTIGSDHFPICSKVGVDIEQRVGERMLRWRFKSADWDKYKELCESKMKEISKCIEDVDVFNKEICKVLQSTAEEVIGKRKAGTRRKAMPWWNEECNEAIKRRNKALKRVRRSLNFNDLVSYKRAQAIVRRVIRTSKRNYWREFCNRIGEDIEISELWNMIRKMGGIQRDYNIPVLEYNNRQIISESGKAEVFAETFVKVHSNSNLSEDVRKARDQTLSKYPHLLEEKGLSGSTLDSEFTLYEVKKALAGVKQTSPGRDDICYEMVKHLSETALEPILRLFNKVWESGKLPNDWKHGVIVPIPKPGKDHTQPSNYRPIALTSNLCKIMERMVMSRLVYVIERDNILSPYQSGFRKGRNTMDSVLCLESEIRKAQVNKEALVGVFFDVEKAYDMMWKEGLLIKLEKMEIKGRMYNWIRDFLFNRTIQVRVSTAFSQIHTIENGTPQGSVSSPILFNIMINDIFTKVDRGIGRSLYADDGALWKRGRNVKYVEKCLQNAVKMVENWANEWGFRFSVDKTQVICFAKRKSNPTISIKLYGQEVKQTAVVRFLGIWMDLKLNFSIHIQKLVDKCKKALNIMRCLAGVDWGACRQSLKIIYCALIRSAIDYGSMVYCTASKTQLVKLEAIQSQAMRICCGAFRSSPISAVQVEMGLMPQVIRRLKLKMRYFISIKGHSDSHPVKMVLEDCWEYGHKKLSSFGWKASEEARRIGLSDFNVAPTVARSAIPPWLFPMPLIDIQLLKEKHNDTNRLENVGIQQYIDQTYYSAVQIYTDGSKDPEFGKTAVAVYIPLFNIRMSKRTSDHISVFTAEIIAICLALQWIEEIQPTRAVICTDSLSALNSLESGTSSARQDMINQVMQSLYRTRQYGILVNFVWVPSHMGVKGNEEADNLAKQALNHSQIDVEVALSKTEIKVIIAKQIQEIWQKEWNEGTKGRHFYCIQGKVGSERRRFGNRKEDVLVTRMRIGHCLLNQCLQRIGKHENGNCDKCGLAETVEHVLIECEAYERERSQLRHALRNIDINELTLQVLLGEGTKQSRIYHELFIFLKETGLFNRM